MKEKKPHQYWYYFGKCIPYPKQIEKGMLPNPPYKKFETKQQCQKYIDNEKPR